MAEEYVDVIKDGEIQRVTEQEAREEGLFILRRPTLVPGSTTPAKSFISSTPRTARSGRPTYSLDYSHNNVKSELVEHFNWEIAKYRKLKNLSRKQLANLVGTSEENIKMLENGELPADNFSLISKIEHYLGVVLRRTSSTGSMGMAKPAQVTQSISSPSNPYASTRGNAQSIYASRHAGRSDRVVDPKTVTLAELQKRREVQKAVRESGAVKDFKSSNKDSKPSISGGDIEIIE